MTQKPCLFVDLAGCFAEARFAAPEEEKVRFWACRGKSLVHTRERGGPKPEKRQTLQRRNTAFYHASCLPLHKLRLSCKTPTLPPGKASHIHRRYSQSQAGLRKFILLIAHSWLNYINLRGGFHVLEGVVNHQKPPKCPQIHPSGLLPERSSH